MICAVYLITQSCAILCNPMDSSLPGSSVHGDSPGKNTAVGCHTLLQGIFPSQGLNPGLMHCRQILYHLSYREVLVIPSLTFLLNCCCCLVAKSGTTVLQPHGLWPTRLLCPWDFPGKNSGVGGHFLFQGIFPSQGLNPCLLHWQVDSLPLNHQGSLEIQLLGI